MRNARGSEGKRRGRRRALDWLRDPELRAVLSEFRRRGELVDEERAAYLEQWGA